MVGAAELPLYNAGRAQLTSYCCFAIIQCSGFLIVFNENYKKAGIQSSFGPLWFKEFAPFG